MFLINQNPIAATSAKPFPCHCAQALMFLSPNHIIPPPAKAFGTLASSFSTSVAGLRAKISLSARLVLGSLPIWHRMGTFKSLVIPSRGRMVSVSVTDSEASLAFQNKSLLFQPICILFILTRSDVLISTNNVKSGDITSMWRL